MSIVSLIILAILMHFACIYLKYLLRQSWSLHLWDGKPISESTSQSKTHKKTRKSQGCGGSGGIVWWTLWNDFHLNSYRIHILYIPKFNSIHTEFGWRKINGELAVTGCTLSPTILKIINKRSMLVECRRDERQRLPHFLDSSPIFLYTLQKSWFVLTVLTWQLWMLWTDLTTVESGSWVSIPTMLHQMDELWTHLDAIFGLSRQLVLELDPRVNQAWARVLTSDVRLVDVFYPK